MRSIDLSQSNVDPRFVLPKLLTIPQTGIALGASTRTVWRLLAAGELERVQLGRAVRVTASSVDRLIQRGGAR